MSEIKGSGRRKTGCRHNETGRFRGIISVPTDGGLIPVRVTLSENYSFPEEDPEVYSDFEEPFKHINRYEFPDVELNIKEKHQEVQIITKTKTVLKEVVREVPVAQDPGQSDVTLTKLATLVQKQKETLAEAGYQTVPTKDKGPQVTGAVPKKRFPVLKLKTLDCPVCNAHFPTHQKMRQHYSTHTKVSDCTCEICQKAFATKGGYDNHMILHGTYKCFLQHTCQHRFPSRSSLKDHLMQDPIYSQLDQYYICEHCLKNFASIDTMLKHRKRRCLHNPNIKLDYFFCKFCGSRYKEKKYLHQHESKCPKRGKPRKGGKGSRSKKPGNK